MSDALQRLIDEAEIRNRLARIAQIAVEGDLDDSIVCFSESATWIGSGWRLASRTIVQPE